MTKEESYKATLHLMKTVNDNDKWFWLGRLVDINDKKSNNSTSLNPKFFAERFEFN